MMEKAGPDAGEGRSAMDRLWAMEVFAKVVETGSLSRAATHLNLANASVTTCIRSLEAHLGVTLLHRTTRHVTLTDEGSTFYAHARSILGQVEEAEASVAPSGSHLRGTLRAELPIAVGHLIVGPAMRDFASRHPDLRVMVSLTNDTEDLLRRGVDVAIRMDEIEEPDLVARRIYQTKYALCASPDFLAMNGTPSTPADIDPRRCVGYAGELHGKPRPWQFTRDTEAHTIEPAGNLFFNSSDALLRTAARGAGFVYVLDVLAQRYLQRGAIVAVLPEWETATQTFYAVYPASRFISPKVRSFVGFVTELFRQSERRVKG
jgi:LysR family transcriptional regulator for bpeEF and oprC